MPASTLPFLPPSEQPPDQTDAHYPLHLTPAEKQWSDLYPYISRRGYELRARYRPGWVGSWISEGLTTEEMMLRPGWRYEYEDAVPSTGRLTVIDATRTSDGTPVALKLISLSTKINTPDSNELEILQYLSSPSLTRDPKNHCIEMIDGFEVFTPAEMKEISAQGFENAFIAVFPYARKWKDVPFRLVWEGLEFVKQVLEGLAFLHEHNIAHRDIRSENIMMDASSQCFSSTSPADRIDNPPRYLLIDLGSSTKFDPETPRLVHFRHGWHKQIPEIYDINEEGKKVPTRLYDAFKGDVFVLGMILEGYFGKSIPSLRFLFIQMQNPIPTERPTASESFALFHESTRHLYDSPMYQLIKPIADPSLRRPSFRIHARSSYIDMDWDDGNDVDDADTDAELELQLDPFTKWIVWLVAWLWGWVDYVRLVGKVMWRRQVLRMGE